ncbi:hypothetical protein BDN71DRAFT_1434496 [Pleurotus eryngii]|uniref:Uncharacterized protein n=1 Tax=Pleurotus eryngii TaxID=5323 RepID=A0A9P5ZNN5_PLEER|nr:hypothetical protein BDN71DRAFT_1434496 [Pleurotus eryngii]
MLFMCVSPLAAGLGIPYSILMCTDVTLVLKLVQTANASLDQFEKWVQKYARYAPSHAGQIRVNGLAVRVEVQMRYYCMIITQITSHGDMILIPLPALVRASPTPVNLRVSAISFLTVAEVSASSVVCAMPARLSSFFEYNWDMMESSVTWQLKSIWMRECSQEGSLPQIEKGRCMCLVEALGWHEPQVHPPLHYILPNRLLREIQGTTFKERSACDTKGIITRKQGLGVYSRSGKVNGL